MAKFLFCVGSIGFIVALVCVLAAIWTADKTLAHRLFATGALTGGPFSLYAFCRFMDGESLWPD